MMRNTWSIAAESLGWKGRISDVGCATLRFIVSKLLAEIVMCVVVLVGWLL